MNPPEDAVGAYWEQWCPAGENTHPDTVDEEGFRRVGTASTIFPHYPDSDPEDYTEEAVSARQPDDWKIKNHTWLYADVVGDDKTCDTDVIPDDEKSAKELKEEIDQLIGYEDQEEELPTAAIWQRIGGFDAEFFPRNNSEEWLEEGDTLVRRKDVWKAISDIYACMHSCDYENAWKLMQELKENLDVEKKPTGDDPQ